MPYRVSQPPVLTTSTPDACISWEQTVPALNRLREGVRGRRENVRRKALGMEAAATKACNGVAANGNGVANGAH